jgi:hypothetical protein
LSLLDSLFEGIARLVGLPTTRDDPEPPPHRAIPLPPGPDAVAAEPEAKADAEVQAEVQAEPDVEAPTKLRARSRIDAAVAQLPKLELAVLVGLERGTILAHHRPEPGPELAEFGVAVREIWADPRLLAVEQPAAALAQVVINTEDVVYVLARVVDHDEALIVVCRDPTNLGLVLTRVAGIVRG